MRINHPFFIEKLTMLVAKLNEKYDISMAIYIRFTLGCKRWEVEHQELEWLCKYQWNAGMTCIFVDANLAAEQHPHLTQAIEANRNSQITYQCF
ncbi:hypothetical protein [Serratia symbiotica]|uniref:Uncharacterized protein n=1 Tax=Serratia symbiotica TaxID=138074 RepID=A0A7D5NM88_9GAMM|nr:hypothetical protein [Serratia symbiotica]MBF1994506.1 hypothetical protein [Serratia symbiotica]MBQ0956040.1 hypothetical protein [Serratia symbiotica]QLH63128.1 hypothetical protein SYMBAF_09565 [Serratia symbiotica]QTP15203.1 hypothetical protein GPZ83_0004415 [Serratia symbiotica]